MPKTIKELQKEDYALLNQCSGMDKDIEPLNIFRNSKRYSQDEVDEIVNKAIHDGTFLGTLQNVNLDQLQKELKIDLTIQKMSLNVGSISAEDVDLFNQIIQRIIDKKFTSFKSQSNPKNVLDDISRVGVRVNNDDSLSDESGSIPLEHISRSNPNSTELKVSDTSSFAVAKGLDVSNPVRKDVRKDNLSEDSSGRDTLKVHSNKHYDKCSKVKDKELWTLIDKGVTCPECLKLLRS